MTTQYFFIDGKDEATSKTSRIYDYVLFSLYRMTRHSLDVLDKSNDIVSRYLGQRAIPNEKTNDSRTSHSNQTGFNARATFEDAFIELVKTIGTSVILVFDALDECVDRQPAHLLRSLQRLTNEEGCNIKVLISGRPEDDLTTSLMGSSRINIEKHNEKDILRHLEGEMERLPGFSTSERSDAVREIANKAGTYFSYIPLAVDFMRQPWQRPLSEHLKRLPKGLENIYAQ